jgi:UDP-glucose 4-epimerase
MKNILVTGGAGFIGSHTVVELDAAGYRPIIVDDFSNSEGSALSGITRIIGRKPPFYEGRFQDPALLKKIFVKEKVDGVIHFAASKAVGESVEKPLLYYKNNVAGLVNLLETMDQAKVPYLVFSSSCTVYGEPDSLPITEEAPIKPANSPYGATKQMCETIIRDTAAVSKNLRALSLRYFNPIGAHHSALIGELPRGIPANLVPFVTQTAAGIRPKLTVFGNDYGTADGTCVRDYIHVIDLAQAHIKALEHISKQKAGYYDVCNVGTGKGSSVLEVIKKFEKVTGRKVPCQIGPRRAGDTVQAYADVKKSKKMLGWQAQKSLSEALADAWRWQKTLSGI